MDKYTYKNDKYFRSSSLYTSAFLFAKGLTLVNVDKTTSPKFVFVFIDTPDREYLLNQFNFSPDNCPDCLVDVRKFILAVKTLKDKLYQGEM
jgi:hypothetical protein